MTFTNPAVWNKLYRRDFLNEFNIRFISTRFAEDVAFTKMAFVLANRISYVNEPLIYYRRMRGNNNESLKVGEHLSFLSAIEELYKDLVHHGVFFDVEKSFCDFIINMLEYELRSYATHEDRFSVYQLVFENDAIKSSEVLNHDINYYSPKRNFNYIKGLQTALAFHNNHYHSFASQPEHTILLDNRISDTPFFTIIIPVYNKENNIAGCIDSILSQNCVDYELLLIDDGSTDRSLPIMFSSVREKNGTAIITKEKEGPSFARNLGISLSKGRYILFLDADNELVPEALDTLKQNLSDQDILYCDSSVIDDPKELEDNASNDYVGNYAELYSRPKTNVETSCGVELFDQLVRNRKYYFNPGLQVISRQYLTEHGIRFPDVILHEDILYTFQAILQAASASYLKTALFCQRMLPASDLTTQAGLENVYGYFKSYFEIWKSYCSFKSKINLSKCQASILQFMQSVLTSTRREFLKLPENEKWFYIGMVEEERLLFEAAVVDPCSRQNSIDVLSQRVKKLERDVSTFKRDSDQQKVKISSLQTSLDVRQKRLTILEAELDSSQRELAMLRSDLESERKALADLQVDYDSRLREIDALKTEVSLKEKTNIELTTNLQLSNTKYEIEHTKLLMVQQSNAYRIGRMITWPFRKLKSLLRHYRKF